MSKTFPLAGIPLPGEILLLTDQLFSPADFMLHQLLQTQLKGRSDSRCIILSTSNDFVHWKTIASKAVCGKRCWIIYADFECGSVQNMNLEQNISANLLTFVDVMSIIPSSLNTMKPLYDHLNRILKGIDSPTLAHTLVVLDDISTLEWIGVPVPELCRFTRALCSLCKKV